jgi:hypothetical protein
MISSCRLCKTGTINNLLDLGMQPICNRFLSDPSEEEYMHPLIIGQCNACGLIQIIDPIPVNELLPRYDWITYNEPEEHLDELADIISHLPGLTRESAICGVSFKDDSALMRLKELGFKNIWRIDPEGDLNIYHKGIGVETIQSYLTHDTVDMIVKKHGTFDVIIARHILEHAFDLYEFMFAVSRLARSEGYIIFEVPDCERAIEKLDYTTLWEEHIAYFTPETFRQSFAFGNFSLFQYKCYPYPFENSLVGIACLKGKDAYLRPESFEDKEKKRAQDFAIKLPTQRLKIKSYFSRYKKNKGNIALFGAGHLACTYINLLNLKDEISFVADDNPKKQGFVMPGSHIPIRTSDALLTENIKLCLLSLSPQAEPKVIRKNQAFIENGGEFASIFPESIYAMKL